MREILKVFLHPPPPLERESFIRTLELTIPKVTTLSIPKQDCENYLLRIIGSNTRDADEGSSLPDGPIACHYTPPPRNYDLTIKSTPGFVPFVTG